MYFIQKEERTHSSRSREWADFDFILEMFKYKGDKLVSIGDVPLSGGGRVLLFSSDVHLEIQAINSLSTLSTYLH